MHQKKITNMKTKVPRMIHFYWPLVKAHWHEMISQLVKDIYQSLGIFKDLGNFPF